MDKRLSLESLRQPLWDLGRGGPAPSLLEIEGRTTATGLAFPDHESKIVYRGIGWKRLGRYDDQEASSNR